MKKILPIALMMTLSSAAAFAGPYLSANSSSMNSFGYTTGAATSMAQTVVIESAIMAVSSGNVTATAPADYEISLNNTTFSSSATIPYTNDALPATNVYIRLKSGLTAGEFNNEQLQFAATGVSTSVALNGIITAPCTVTNGTLTANSASFTWNTTGAASYEVKVDQTASAPTTAGTVATTGSYTASNLNAGTSYFFHVRGKGTNGNYTSWENKAFSTKTTSISTARSNDFDVQLLPNPNRGAFTVSGHPLNVQQVFISVMNVSGQLVYQTAASLDKGSFKQAITLADNIPAGMYFVRLSANGQSSVTRFAVTQ